MTDNSLNKAIETQINIGGKLSIKLPWIPENLQDSGNIPKGDMPGDKIVIGNKHIQKAQIIFPRLLELLIPVLEGNSYQRAVVGVCGGSGVGKSEIASLLSYYLNRINVGSYTLSGDNYPYRMPIHNDAERIRIFRQCGIKGLISGGLYKEEIHSVLKVLQEKGDDADATPAEKYPWLLTYQNAGRSGLKNYLGTSNEIDFTELNGIISQFKNGGTKIFLKRMGREDTELWYEQVDFTGKNVMVIEWTHGNNHNLQGVDIPILLNSTPEETLEHRRARNRDGGTDSPFTAMVLSIEQELLVSQASKAKLIVSGKGEFLSYNNLLDVMLRKKSITMG